MCVCMCCMACVHAYVPLCVRIFTYHMFRQSPRSPIAIAAREMPLLRKQRVPTVDELVRRPARPAIQAEYSSAVARLKAYIEEGKISFEEIEDEAEPFDPLTQYAWEEEPREFWPTKPCTWPWCKAPTQKGCKFCEAEDRFPALQWEKDHPTPLCERCEYNFGQCWICRDQGFRNFPVFETAASLLSREAKTR